MRSSGNGRGGSKSPIDIFAEGARDGVYPGGQLAVSRECEQLVNAAVGLLGPGQEKTTPQVLYDLASLTKPLATALLIARAVERNLCAWDDPIARFVPGVDPAITIAHALEHSSGLPAHRRFDQELPAELKPGSWDAWRDIVMRAAAVPRDVDAGALAVYSDLGFILLGAALEVMYAMPLSTAYLLTGAPLAFRDHRGPPSLGVSKPAQPIAPTEIGVPGGLVHDENARAMGGVAGHAGLFGTAEGVLKIGEQLVLAYHGWRGGFLQPETVRRMWQASNVPGSTRTLGWDRPADVNSSTGGRWPSHSVGHLGFTGTSLWIEPQRALVVVLVTNRVCPTRANNLIRRLRPLLHDAAWGEWAKAKAAPGQGKARPPRPRPQGGVHTPGKRLPDV